jgi:hypothetical protein
LIADGLLPRPDIAWIANTGREFPGTWKDLEEHIQPLLSSTVGLTIEILEPSHSKPALYSKPGTLLLPVFTSTGKLSAYCSGYWKREIQRAEMRARGYGPDKPVRQWFGYSTNEAHRAKGDSLPWITHEFPLLTMYPMRADECISLLVRRGIPTSRSRCIICPHQQNEEWKEVRAIPAAWEEAVRTDRAVRALDTRGGVYLHKDCVPLEDANLETEQEDALLGPRCSGSECFT